MATPTGPAKLIFANGERCDCVLCSPLEAASERKPECDCAAKPITVAVEIVATEHYGSLPRQRSRLAGA